MKTEKKIEVILPRPAQPGMVGDGFRVYNYFPNGYRIREKISPFLMLDFAPAFHFGPSAVPRGVGVHPHKGFETVTIAYKGSVEHADSRGHRGVIHPGDVQWMTAGAGILHKEFHETAFSKQGGLFEMVQLWVNLPARDKGTAPAYQSLSSTDIPHYQQADGQVDVAVIAGQCEEVIGKAHTFTEMNVWDVRMKQGAAWTMEIPATHQTGILVIEGQVKVNEQPATEHAFVLFGMDGERIQVQTDAGATLLVLSGVPIREPVAQYGPFVMNTPEELEQAFVEFQNGAFGTLD